MPQMLISEIDVKVLKESKKEALTMIPCYLKYTLLFFNQLVLMPQMLISEIDIIGLKREQKGSSDHDTCHLVT